MSIDAGFQLQNQATDDNTRAQDVASVIAARNQVMQQQAFDLDQARQKAAVLNNLRDQTAQQATGLQMPTSVPGLDTATPGSSGTSAPNLGGSDVRMANADVAPGVPTAQNAALGLPTPATPAATATPAGLQPPTALANQLGGGSPTQGGAAPQAGSIPVQSDPFNSAQLDMFKRQAIAAAAEGKYDDASKAMQAAKALQVNAIRGAVYKHMQDNPGYADEILGRHNVASPMSGEVPITFEKDKNGLTYLVHGAERQKLTDSEKKEIVANMHLMNVDPDAAHVGLTKVYEELGNHIKTMNDQEDAAAKTNVEQDKNVTQRSLIALERQKMYMPGVQQEKYQTIDPTTGRAVARDFNIVRQVDPKTGKMNVSVLDALGQPVDPNSPDAQQILGKVNARTQDLADAHEQYRSAFEKLSGDPNAYFSLGPGKPSPVEALQQSHATQVATINAKHDLLALPPSEQLSAAQGLIKLGATTPQDLVVRGVPPAVAQAAFSTPQATPSASPGLAPRPSMAPPPTLDQAMTGATGDATLRGIYAQHAQAASQAAAAVKAARAAMYSNPSPQANAALTQAGQQYQAAIQALPPEVQAALRRSNGF